MQIGEKWGKMTVVGVKEITHGKFFTNRSIVQQVSTKGQRGGHITFSITTDGKVATRIPGKEFAFEGRWHLDGATGELHKIN